MISNSQHLNAIARECRVNTDALPFFLGYLLSDIPEERLCKALTSWVSHLEDLEELQAPGLALVQVEESTPGD